MHLFCCLSDYILDECIQSQMFVKMCCEFNDNGNIENDDSANVFAFSLHVNWIAIHAKMSMALLSFQFICVCVPGKQSFMTSLNCRCAKKNSFFRVAKTASKFSIQTKMKRTHACNVPNIDVGDTSIIPEMNQLSISKWSALSSIICSSFPLIVFLITMSTNQKSICTRCTPYELFFYLY